MRKKNKTINQAQINLKITYSYNLIENTLKPEMCIKRLMIGYAHLAHRYLMKIETFDTAMIPP